MNNAVFGKTIENIRKHKDIKLVTTRKKELFSIRTKLSYNNLFLKIYQLQRNKAVYLSLSILDISKIVMHEFWYDQVKPKYGEKAKLCYIDTDSIIVYIKQKTFTQTLQKILKLDLILKTMNQIDLCLKEKNKVIDLMKMNKMVK